MRKLFLLFSFLLGGMGSYAQIQKIYFDSDKFALSENEKLKLKQIASNITTNFSERKISITGFTDSDADQNYNTKLALKRAKEVKNYLASLGLSNEIFLFSKGETNLVLESGKNENKSASRRVVIDFNYKEENKIDAIARNKENTFVISALRDTILTCEKGTKIEIFKDIFDTPFKTIPIIIKVEEYLEKQDFIFAGLNTIDDNGNLIESRGMINISATQRGKEIKVKRDRNFYVLFKDRIEGDSTELFYGKKQNDELVWELAKDSLVEKRKHYAPFYTRSKLEYGHSEVVGNIANNDIYLHDKIDTTYLVKHQIKSTNFSRAYPTAMSSTRTGWINCDRFVDDEGEKMDLIVENKGNEDANIVLFFSDLNAMLPPVQNLDGYITFKDVPVGSKVSIIGVYAKDEDQPMDVAIISTMLDPCENYVLDYKKMDVKTFKSVLKKV